MPGTKVGPSGTDLPPVLRLPVTHSGEFVTSATRASDLAAGDLILHPHPDEDGALHRVVLVEHEPDHVVIHSEHVRTRERRTYRAANEHILLKVVAGVLSLLATIGVGTAVARQAYELIPIQGPITVQTVELPPGLTTTATAPVLRPVPAPRTTAGYRKMFAALDPAQWGGGDIALTVPLADGRSVWLFGDTLSARADGFVHSSAIVQVGGRLHVSRGGAQLIPNDDATHIYWIQSAEQSDRTHLAVTVRSIVLTGTGLWDFADGGSSRVARCSVSASGDVRFQGWVGARLVSQAPDPGPMYNFGDGNTAHFGYSRFSHPELRLRDGNILVTTSQNWTDPWAQHRNPDGSFRWTDYQPVFSEAVPLEPATG